MNKEFKRMQELAGVSLNEQMEDAVKKWLDGYLKGTVLTSKDDIKKYGKESFRRTILSLHETPGRVNYEETRQLFLNNVLIEQLTDGTPAFYNSNILGRYYRKDYFTYDC